jgi:hypothetical protein
MASPPPRSMVAHSPLAFVENTQAPVALIEVTSDGVSRRLEVTEELTKTYIKNDFSVSRIGDCYMTTLTNSQSLGAKAAQQPDSDVIKLLCERPFLVRRPED